MFDIGMAEMVVIGVVALIIVGPKDLPVMFRRVGQFVGRMRGMARDFQRAMDQAADDSGLKDVADTVKTATTMKNLGLDDAAKSLAAVNEDWKAKQEAKKADPAAEHAARQKAVEDANKAAENWSSGGAETKSDAPSPKKPAAKKTTAKKPASKTTPAKKAAAAKTAAKKPSTKKKAAKKPAAKSAEAKAPAAKKSTSRKKAAPKQAEGEA